MCGIIGSIGEKPNSNLSSVFTSILSQTEARGHHATGVACVTNNVASYMKQGIPATTFIRTKAYKNAMKAC